MSSGERIKRVRGYLNISRKIFCQKHNFPEITMKSWELGITQISEKQLKKLLRAFEIEGISVSEEWIIKGEGSPPLDAKGSHSSNNQKILDKGKDIQWEQASLLVFRDFHPNGIVFQIKDPLMAPFFQEGDLVCGIPCQEAIIQGTPYIIEEKEGDYQVRLLFSSSKEKCFSYSTLQNQKGFLFHSDKPLLKIYTILLVIKKPL